MADEEKSVVQEVKKKSPLNKVLLFGILGILLALAIIGVSIITSTYMTDRQTATVVKSDKPPVAATYALKEFMVSTRDNQGIIKAEIELGLSDLKMIDIMSKSVGEIRDRVNIILTSKNLMEANETFASRELHKEIMEAVNEIISSRLKAKSSFFGTTSPPQVVDVFFLNFFAK